MILLKTCESRLRASRIKWWVTGGGLWDGMAGKEGHLGRGEQRG